VIILNSQKQSAISDPQVKVEYVSQVLISHLPLDNVYLLHRLFHFAHTVTQYQQYNKMVCFFKNVFIVVTQYYNMQSATNIATVLGPNLFAISDPLEMAGGPFLDALTVTIENAPTAFSVRIILCSNRAHKQSLSF
jgi:hypothetical protein